MKLLHASEMLSWNIGNYLTTRQSTRISRTRISSNKRRASNNRRPLISVASLGIHIEISAFLLIRAAPLNTVLIRIVIIFY